MKAFFAREVVRREAVARAAIVREEGSEFKWRPVKVENPTVWVGEPPECEEAASRKALHIEAVQWWASTIHHEANERMGRLSASIASFLRNEATYRRRIEAEQLRTHREVRVSLIVVSRHTRRGLVKNFIVAERAARDEYEMWYSKDIRRLNRELVHIYDALEEAAEVIMLILVMVGIIMNYHHI